MLDELLGRRIEEHIEADEVTECHIEVRLKDGDFRFRSAIQLWLQIQIPFAITRDNRTAAIEHHIRVVQPITTWRAIVIASDIVIVIDIRLLRLNTLLALLDVEEEISPGLNSRAGKLPHKLSHLGGKHSLCGAQTLGRGLRHRRQLQQAV